MAESIWEKSLGQDISNHQLKNIYINSDYKYPLEKMYLRNYINTHSLEEINPESLYHYFGEAIYKDTKGLFITHLLCRMPSVPFEKKYKALQAAFQFISPNVGTITPENINYLQYSLVHGRNLDLEYTSEEYIKLYQLGIDQGLDKAYVDVYNQSICHYFLAFASFKTIKNCYKTLLYPEGCIKNVYGYQPLDYIWLRIDVFNGSVFNPSEKNKTMYEQLKKMYGDDIGAMFYAEYEMDEIYTKVKQYVNSGFKSNGK